MSDQIRGIEGPTVVAAGRLHMAHGAAFAWLGAHPGFSDTIANAAAGVATVTTAPTAPTPGGVLPFDLTAETVLIFCTSETANQIVSATRSTATTLTVRSLTVAGVATDGDIDILVLVV